MGDSSGFLPIMPHIRVFRRQPLPQRDFWLLSSLSGSDTGELFLFDTLGQSFQFIGEKYSTSHRDEPGPSKPPASQVAELFEFQILLL